MPPAVGGCRRCVCVTAGCGADVPAPRPDRGQTLKYRSLPLFLAFLPLLAAACGGGEDQETRADAAIVSFLATPDHVQMGAPVELQWTTRGATSIEILDDAGSVVPVGSAGTSAPHPAVTQTHLRQPPTAGGTYLFREIRFGRD